MKKQTAANNKLLKQIKKRFNHKIFAKASKIVNEKGEQAAIEYMQQFSTREISFDEHEKETVFSCECCDADFDKCDGWVNDEHIKCGECIGMENNPY